MCAFQKFFPVVIAFGCMPAEAVDTSAANGFAGPAVIISGNIGPIAQTLSPESSALSLVFQGFQVEQQGVGTRSGLAFLALQIPLSLSGPRRIKAELRGGVNADKAAVCKISFDGPDTRTELKLRQTPHVYVMTHIPVSSTDDDMRLLISLRCTGRLGTRPVFFAALDSLDLSIEGTRKR